MVSSTLSFGDLTASLTGKVITPEIAAQDPESSLKPEIVLMDGTTVSTTKDLGAFSGSESVIATLSAKNIGNLASSPALVELSDAVNFSLSYNACSNRALAKNASCLIKVVFSE